MSRVAKNPIVIPEKVDIKINDNNISITGPNGNINHHIPKNVKVTYEGNLVVISVLNNETDTNALAGTTRAIINNSVAGVSKGYEKKLTLKGVGYKALLKDNILVLSLGFSHPVEYKIPKDITIEVPTQTELTIKGRDKQQVGQVASEIRRFRPPEPYKGKGVRYTDEVVKLKETKKK